jgi:hypothetical protein
VRFAVDEHEQRQFRVRIHLAGFMLHPSSVTPPPIGTG